jgi:hypothetical protein
MKRLVVGLGVALCVAWPGAASSQPLLPTPAPVPPPDWSAALDAYGGYGLLFTSDRIESHALGGGMTRLRYRHLQLGAYAELAGYVSSRVTHLGGVAGVYVPYRNFADIEGWVGFGMRRYVDDDRSFGPGGFEVSTPALSLRLGVSDRAGDVLGVRLGGQLLATFDLDPENVAWRIEPSESNPEGASGTRHVGGTSIVMLLVAGFDVAPSAVSPGGPPRRTSGRQPQER